MTPALHYFLTCHASTLVAALGAKPSPKPTCKHKHSDTVSTILKLVSTQTTWRLHPDTDKMQSALCAGLTYCHANSNMGRGSSRIMV